MNYLPTINAPLRPAKYVQYALHIGLHRSYLGYPTDIFIAKLPVNNSVFFCLSASQLRRDKKPLCEM
jgi:hypothetical protein